MWKLLKDVKSELDELRTNGIQRGKSIGWSWEQLPLTIKKGYTTYLGAPPATGKTEWLFEILINLSCIHGWKHVVYSPETGSAHEIYAELCHKYIGKPYVKGKTFMDETERTKAEYFINDHFVVIDPHSSDENQKFDFTIDMFFKTIIDIETHLDIKFDTTTIDPWNELTEEYQPNDLGREDKYLSRILGEVRVNARVNKRHNFVLNHVRDQQIVTKDNVSFYPMPTARDFAGGQVWFRKGLLMIIMWRPPYGLLNEDGIPYEKNEVHIKIAKSKPKGVSTNGTYKMFLDTERYQYYMLGFGDVKIYADRVQHASKQNTMDFNEQKKSVLSVSSFATGNDDFDFFEQTDEVPF